MSHEGDVFEGKTLDAAVRSGLDALGLSRAEVMITILEEGSSGFLGLGARPFRVRVMRRIGGPPSVEGDRDSRRRHEGRDRRGREGREGRDRRERRGPGREGGGEGFRGPGGERRRDRPEERRGDARREARGERGPSSRPMGGGAPEPGRGPGGGRREERREGYRGDRREERREGYRGDRREARREGYRGDRGESLPDDRREERREGYRERDEERAVPLEAERPDLESAPGQEPAVPDEGHRRRRRGRRGGRRRQGLPAEGAPGAESLAAEPRALDQGAQPGGEEVDEEDRFVEPAGAAPRPPAVQAPSLGGDELAAQSRRLTEDLLKAMGFEATVTATVDGNHVEVTAEVARDEDLLTGRKGEVRQALQHLLNRVLNRGESSRYHLQLEINDFWKRREEELRELARSLAEEAVTSGGEAVTEYLNAQERRIVHVTLREDTRVKTYALGTGMIKRVAIAPAAFEGGPRDEGE